MSQIATGPLGVRVADGMGVPRPQLAGALCHALGDTTVAEHAVALAATTLYADVALCESPSRLPEPQRDELRRAESQSIEQAEGGRLDGAYRAGPVVVLHGEGWSVVGRSGPVLLFLLDAAPGLVIDRSLAEGAAELVAEFTTRVP